MAAAEILFGTAGWSYADWQGTVYPDPLPAGFNHLAFLAEQLNFVEVNTTFYRIPALSLTSGWVRKTASLPRFSFWVKIHQNFTHRLQLDDNETTAFQTALKPLADAGKLEGLLAQFPFSFKFSEGNLGYLHRLSDCFATVPLAVEFRHSSWENPETSEFFASRRLVWTNIDQPLIGASLPLGARLTHPDIAYFRLHGRNYKNWFGDAGRDARYDYLYTLGELGQIAETIRKLREQAKKIFVSGNNHYQGSALKNLIQLKEMLAG